jgi:RecB family exonuclease
MTNQDLQNKLIELLENGYTVLVESEKFVHQVQRQFRSRRLQGGDSAWDAPRIFTLNRWMDNIWAGIWPGELPASSRLLRWKYLKECLDETPRPEPLPADTELVHLLDESFEQCLRHGIDPAGGEESNRLIGWRRRVWRSFKDRLDVKGLFHPAQLPEKLTRHLATGSTPDFGKMALVGFEFAGYWEKHLLEELRKNARVVSFALPAGNVQPEFVVYSDPEQEVVGLMENLLTSAGECAPHEIAVVVLDSEFYGPAVADLLRDILGEPVKGERAAYNLSPHLDLSRQGLFNAALLPIRFALCGEKRNDLFTFLRSPYYGAFSRWSRFLSRWDRIWRDKRIESGMDLLLGSVRDSAAQILPGACDGIAAAIVPFSERDARLVSDWAGSLRRVWASLEFPQIANELDRIAWDNLVEMLSEFETAFAKTRVGSHDFYDLLISAARRVRIQKSGIEDAGIQVLGRLDARGLAFQKIFIPGMVSAAFPQAVRSLPLLSASERKKVLGGTVESQLEFARHVYSNFLAAAPQVTFSRPAAGPDGEIRISSPFWSGEGEKSIDPVIPWRHRVPAMQRARWVKQSLSGISALGPLTRNAEACTLDRTHFKIKPLKPSDRISVSELESALLCPARYFFLHILGLAKLDEYEPGISPLDRGKNVHAIMAAFVLLAIRRPKRTEVAFEDLAELLKETAVKAIRPRLSEAVWQVELKRLIGKPGSPGLLIKWLEAEWERICNGWSWVGVESRFDGMAIDGCETRIKGRLDRIDSHSELGLICWDYKTGRLPGRNEVVDESGSAQLKAYLLALSKGNVTGAPAGRNGCGAGYIELGSPARTGHRVMFDPAGQHGPLLELWEKEVCNALNSILEGDVSPRWIKEEQPCKERCEFMNICEPSNVSIED